MVKKGDTLIEVTLAIGIFSMIAIAITAVMSSGTSGAQTALETTLTREEIDTQAEALRFIQTAYAVDKNAADQRFPNLWKQIRDGAITDIDKWTEERRTAVLQYSPTTCDDLYNNNDIKNHAFIINPRQLGTFTSSTTDLAKGIKSVYISKLDRPNDLTKASIYPRLVFSGISATAQDALITDNESNQLYRAEGIYVIAVKDSGTTEIAGGFGPNTEKTSAYYDFYIRTCWYGTDANEPSTISTVIRLYDPDATK